MGKIQTGQSMDPLKSNCSRKQYKTRYSMGRRYHFTLQSAHFETVTKLPVGATLLAQNERGGTEAVKYTNTCWGTQFHPEFDNEDMRLFITDSDEGLIDIDLLVKQLRPTPFGPILFKKFTKMVAEWDLFLTSVVVYKKGRCSLLK